MSFQRFKFPGLVFFLQVAFILIFAFLGEYDDSAKPNRKNSGTIEPVQQYYAMFQDVHVMIFIGFGFLMTFLKRYGYSAVGVNLLLAAFVLQWATIIRGLLYAKITDGERFQVNVLEMMSADFAAAAVLISFGAVLGKTSPLQLLVMALVEVVLQQVNEYVGVHKLHVADVGESMFVHAFGAYFGLAVARVLYSKRVEESIKEGSVYHSDLFSMIGTVFLWIFWPSFNGGAASGDEQHRAVLNTYFSLAACTFITFAVSGMVHKKGRFDMVHIQNATLAGGVAVGTCANMPIEPWGALLIGIVAAFISTLGFKYFMPCLASKIKLHDTCGVNNLHGMPGILAGVAGAVMAALATRDKYGPSLLEIFPAMEEKTNGTANSDMALGRSASIQGGYQLLALVITLAIAIVGGALTGLLLKLPVFDAPKGDQIFDDYKYWDVAEDGVPEVAFDKKQAINDRSHMTPM